MTSPAPDLAAALADRYRLEGEVGAGGMATVYLAHDLRHGRSVAIKVLRAELAALIGRERFLREIQLAASLQHPNILGLIDSGEVGGSLFYIMPYLEGRSLRQVLLDEAVIPPERALRLAVQIAEALDYAHRRNVVHRDIKPENILLQDGQATVADFGIALALDDVDGGRLTQTGFALGTPAYMSPEALTGAGVVDGRSDQYSLACLVYEMLTGAPPFTGPTPHAVMVMQATEMPVMGASIPATATVALLRALAKDPEQRYSTVAEFGAALRGVATDARAPSRPAPSATLVVLPFEISSPNAGDAYIATGLTDEVISDLSRIRAIRVISRNASMRYQGSSKPLRVIGRELGVRFALTGSVRVAGDQVRITAELVDTNTDVPVWSEKYHGATNDVFGLQERISRQLVDALQVAVTPEESRRLAIRAVDDPLVQEVVVLARDAMYSYNPEAANHASLRLHEALASVGDHRTLLGWLAGMYAHRVNIGAVPRDPALAIGDRIATRAMQMAPEQGVGYFAKSYLEFSRAGNLTALPWARMAVERERSADAVMNLGYQLASVGVDHDLAVELEDEAVARDPLTPVFRWYRAQVLQWTGHRDRAAVAYREALQLGLPVKAFSAIGLLACEEYDEARVLFRSAPPSEMIWDRVGLEWLRVLDGERPRFADDVEQHLESMHGSGITCIVDLWAAAGDRRQMFRWMRLAIERGFTNTQWYSEFDPFLRPYHDDPEFLALLARARELQLAAAHTGLP